MRSFYLNFFTFLSFHDHFFYYGIWVFSCAPLSFIHTLFSYASNFFSLCLCLCNYFFLPNYYILLIYFILLYDKSISFPINLPAYLFWDFIALLHHHLPPSASIYFSTVLSCYLSFYHFVNIYFHFWLVAFGPLDCSLNISTLSSLSTI